jgi:hypothetical protein
VLKKLSPIGECRPTDLRLVANLSQQTKQIGVVIVIPLQSTSYPEGYHSQLNSQHIFSPVGLRRDAITMELALAQDLTRFIIGDGNLCVLCEE